MPDLIAQGPSQSDRWRHPVPVGRKLILGRTAGVWATPWDNLISRQHVEMHLHHGRLEVRRLVAARNPIFFRGREVDHVWLKPGENFVIGQTTFSFTNDRIALSLDEPTPMTQQHFSANYLREIHYRNSDQRIDVLSHLPEIIQGAANDTELLVRLVNMLLMGIPRAESVAIVARVPQLDTNEIKNQGRGTNRMEVLHWDRRWVGGDDFRPSQRLIQDSLDRGDSVIHVWKSRGDSERFTQQEDTEWAFCTPVPGAVCRGWAIYVSGGTAIGSPGSSHPSDLHELRDEAKFTELVAATLGSLRATRELERSQASLSQFFSPLVLEALQGEDPDVVLAPCEATVSVLFCDLRGFSRYSEESADDLLGLLNRVSEALGVMTRHILRQGGVVGDFHGDAAMGFWGWPLAQPDAAECACRAALGIRADFEAAARRPGHLLRDFQIGIGVATGPAVAGKIGTVDQVKVTVFGPVVNLAARLESMTKKIRAPILLDDQTAKNVRASFSENDARLRRLATVRPYGMGTALTISELLPSVEQYGVLQPHHLELYERAVDAFVAGDWSNAYDLLARIPTEDRVKDFLTVFIAQHNRTAPADWDGVIPMDSK